MKNLGFLISVFAVFLLFKPNGSMVTVIVSAPAEIAKLTNISGATWFTVTDDSGKKIQINPDKFERIETLP